LGKNRLARTRHFREHATVSPEGIPEFTQIIGILGAWALKEKAPWKFGIPMGT
jgi:hypothetical protein